MDTRAVNHILSHTDAYQKAPDVRHALKQIFGEGEAIAIASLQLTHVDHRHGRTTHRGRNAASSAGLHHFFFYFDDGSIFREQRRIMVVDTPRECTISLIKQRPEPCIRPNADSSTYRDFLRQSCPRACPPLSLYQPGTSWNCTSFVIYGLQRSTRTLLQRSPVHVSMLSPG